MQDKDKIFLMVYVNVSQIDKADVSEYLMNVANSLYFDESVKRLLIPIEDGETRVECINPVLLNEERYLEVEKTFEDAKKKLEDLFSEK